MQSEARIPELWEETERGGWPIRGRWVVPEDTHPDDQRPETD